MKRLLLFISLLPSVLYSQTTFQNTYGTPDNDGFSHMIRSLDGGYVIAGSSFGFGAAYGDAFLYKIDSLGNMLWNKGFVAPVGEEVYSVAATSDSGYVLLLETNSFDVNGIYVSGLIKTDGHGNQLWAKTYNITTGNNFSYPYSVIETNDHGFLIIGATSGELLYAIKTDSTGRLDWSKTYGTGNFYSVKEMNNGDYILTGRTRNYPGPSYRSFLYRIDSSGNAKWAKVYLATANENGIKVISAADTGIMIAGQTVNSGQGALDFFLMRVDTSGVVQWGTTYGGVQSEYMFDATDVPGGGYLLNGLTLSFIFGTTWADILTVSTDALGLVRWSEHYGTPSAEDAYSILPTPDGGAIMSGTMYFFGNGQGDSWLIKTNNQGNSFCHEGLAAVITAPYTIGDSLIQVPTNNGVNIYNKVDFLDSTGLVRHVECFTTGINTQNIQAENFQIELYPSPADDELNINLSSLSGKITDVRIVDVLGNEVFNSMNINYESNFRINIPSLSSGVYFLRLSSDGLPLEKKFIKL